MVWKVKKSLAWIAGGILALVFFSKPFLITLDGLNLIVGYKSLLGYDDVPTFYLLLEAWLVMGFIWWIFLQALGGLTNFLSSFILCWSATLFFFTLLPYFLAAPIWLAFSAIIFLVD